MGRRFRKRIKKDIVDIDSASLTDCYRDDGLGLNLGYITGWNINTEILRIPDSFQSIEATDGICETLLTMSTVWEMEHILAHRILIDAIVTDVLRSTKGRLTGYCNVNNDYETSRVAYSGNVDYLLGFWEETNAAGRLDAKVLVVQAASHCPDHAIAQVICHAGCLLRRRVALYDKKTPVYAVLTIGYGMFQFLLLDVDGTAYSSRMHMLFGDNAGGFKANVSVVMRWFQWFLTCPKAPLLDT